jgi:hypothetical protein
VRRWNPLGFDGFQLGVRIEDEDRGVEIVQIEGESANDFVGLFQLPSEGAVSIERAIMRQ